MVNRRRCDAGSNFSNSADGEWEWEEAGKGRYGMEGQGGREGVGKGRANGHIERLNPITGLIP